MCLAEQDELAVELERAAQQPSPREYLSTLLSYARAAKQAPPMQKSMPALTSALYRKQVAPPLPTETAEVWYRWELAPGVVLQVKADTAPHHRSLIERLLRLAGTPETFRGH